MQAIGSVLRFGSCLVAIAALGCSEADPADDGAGVGAAGGAGAGGASGSGGAGGGPSTQTTRIALGSCMHQSLPKPVLELATASNPDLFVFLGDNIYGDTDDMSVLAAKYEEQAAWPELQALRAAMPTIAIWDDHDYGRNDAGAEYPFKSESKEIFLEFWEEPDGSPRRTHDGNYTSYLFDEPGGTLQVILLDMRWFRDPLDPNTGEGKNDYQPTRDTTRTMLGDAQWTWLEGELQKPADVRIIGTSIQFGHEYNGWESWTNMPHERQHLVDVLRQSGAEVTFFISGDVHWGELSRYDADGGYPLYDLTSSGITEEWPEIEENANRVGEPVPDNNYGFVEIAWGEDDHVITFGLVDVHGDERVHQVVNASELR